MQSVNFKAAARMHRRGIRSRNKERGSALLESAVTLILYLVMLFGILDFGWALYTYHFLSNASREAARWAAVNGTTCGTDAVTGTGNYGSCTAPISASGSTYSLCSPSSGGCTYANQTDIQNYVKMIAPPGINTTSGGCDGSPCLTTTATWQDAKWSTPDPCTSPPEGPGCTVQVKVSYDFHYIIGLGHGPSVTMGSTSEMVIAH